MALDSDEGMSLDEVDSLASKKAKVDEPPADDAGMSLDAVDQLGERKTVLEKLAGAPHRVVMAVGNFINQAITPSNWVAAGKNAADVVGGLFEAPSEPDPLAASPFAFTPEIRQGMIKGATHLPSMLFSDLPQAGARIIIDTLFGPGEYDQVNAIAKEQSVVPNPTDVLSSENFDRAMDVLGLTRVINGRPEEELTSGEQTQRRVGEFLATAPLGGPKAIVPSIAAAPLVRVAEETAPDDPVWQLLTGSLPFVAPGIKSRTIGKLPVVKPPAVTAAQHEAQIGRDIAAARAENPMVAPGTETIKTYHGTPHTVDRPSLDKVGTGQGAQAYGHGLYSAEESAVARTYDRRADMPRVLARSRLAAAAGNKQEALAKLDEEILASTDRAAIKRLKEQRQKITSGEAEKERQHNLYEWNILGRPNEFIEYDKTIELQNPTVRAALEKVIGSREGNVPRIDQRQAAQLRALGVKGIRYLDQGSRESGAGTQNYVTFSDKDIIQGPIKFGPEPLPEIPGVEYTAAQRDPRLQQLQTDAARNDPALRQSLKDQEAAAAKALRGSVDDIGGRGVPSDLNAMTVERLKQADRAALDAIIGVREPKLGGAQQLALEPEQVSRLAAEKLDKVFQEQRNKFRGQYEKFGELGAAVDLDAKPLVAGLKAWENALTDERKLVLSKTPELRDRLNIIKRYVEEAGDDVEIIRHGAPTEAEPPTGRVAFNQLRELNSGLGTLARELSGGLTPNKNAANLARDVHGQVDKYLKNYDKFPDKRITDTYKKLNAEYKDFADRFLNPLESRRVLGRSTTGEDMVSGGDFMKAFTEGGTGGGDAVRTLMRMDNSQAMQELVASHLMTDFQAKATSAANADKWLRQNGPMLRQLGLEEIPTSAAERQAFGQLFKKDEGATRVPGVDRDTAFESMFGEWPIEGAPSLGTSKAPAQPALVESKWMKVFEEARDRVAAAEAIRESRLGRLSDITVESLASQILKSRDPVREIQALRREVFTRRVPGSDRDVFFAGAKNGWEGFKRAYADQVSNLVASGEGISTQAIDTLLKNQGKGIRIALGDRALKTLEDVKKAAQRIESSRVKVEGQPADRTFMDLIVDAAAGGVAYTMTHAIAPTVVAGAGAQVVQQTLRRRGQEILRRALMDGEFANQLAARADAKTVKAMPPQHRRFLDAFIEDLNRAGVVLTPQIAKPETKVPTREELAPPRPVEAPPVAKKAAETGASKKRFVDRGNRRFTVTPTSNGRWIVRVDDIAPEATA